MLVIGFRQKRDGAGNEYGKVENDIGLGHLLHPIGRQGVYQPAEHRQRSHDPHSLVSGGKPVEVTTNGHSRQQKLSRAILGRGHASNLTEQIYPTDHPADRGHPVFRRQSRNRVVQAAASGIRRDQFGHGASNTHAASAGNEPTPDGRGRATGFDGIDKGRGGGRKETGNTHGKRKGREVAELAFEDLWTLSIMITSMNRFFAVLLTYRPVAKLLGQSSVGRIEFVQLDRLAASLCILDLNCSNTSSAEFARIELTRSEVFWCSHGVHGRKRDGMSGSVDAL